MSQDFEHEILGRARMRQHHEEARLLHDIALAEKAAAKPPTSPKPCVGALLARVAWVLGIRRRILAGQQSPAHEEL